MMINLLKKNIFLAFIVFANTSLFAQDMVPQEGPDIIVAQDGSGNFKTIQDAINSLSRDAKAQRVILIKEGTYNEKLFIDKNFVTLRGEDAENTIVTISLARDEWRCSNPDDYGTATLNLKANDITLENLSFINSYGKDVTKEKTITCPKDSSKSKVIRPEAHQMALRSFETTRLIVKNCIFRAYGGDTVSPWNVENGMFYFYNCIMEGGVDFYCPRGWSWAENCTFICHSKEAAIWHDGSKNELSKTVLMNCTFKGDDGFKLGRYHRDAQFYLINCNFPKNMADAEIYQREATPPNVIQWGKRVYYFNCHREGKDYAWFKNNLPAAVDVSAINTVWAYDNKWDPLRLQTVNTNAVSNNATTAPLVAETIGTVATISTIEENTKKITTDPVAENMLLYQRNNGGWPKHFQGEKKVDYKRQLNDDEKKELRSGFMEGIDATIDNDATTKEIKYLVKAYKQTKNEAYLLSAEKGIQYLLKAQYENGGWPQFYPDFSSYRSEITYNDNAMANAMTVLWDVTDGKNDLDVINPSYKEACNKAVQKGLNCILKTQLRQKGKLTAWCAQYDAKTLLPADARKFELVSISGSESVGVVKLLMRVEKPNSEMKLAITAAVEWFDKVKIIGYKVIDVAAPTEKSGKDRLFVPDSTGGVIWARFYDIDNNEPFFCGRDSKKKKTLAEIENERRVGYAWYGTWPAKLLANEYPAWLKKINKQ